jgi:hypothetical protein
MRTENRALVIALALVALSAGAEGLKNASTICAPYYDEMLSKGRAERMSGGGRAQLLPADPASERIRAAILADKPGILVETAFFLPRTSALGEEARRAELAHISGVLRSISTLEGIQYYSVSHKGMRTLYAESYRIDSPDTKKRLADPPEPKPAEMPIEESFYAFQRDLSFGSNVYAYIIRGQGGSVSADMTNLTRLSVGIIPMVAPGALKTRLLVLPATEGILFYAESDTPSAGIFQSRLEESFANRAVALFSWFSSKLGPYIER